MAKRLEIQLFCPRTRKSITLPVNPDTVDITNEKDVQTYNILGYGEVQVRGTKRLKRVTLTNLLPENNSIFALLSTLIVNLNYEPYSIERSIILINGWIYDDEIIRLIISDQLNLPFKITKFTQTIRESTPDMISTLELLEWVDPDKPDIEYKYDIRKITRLKKRLQQRFIPNNQVMKKGMSAYKFCKLNYGGNFQPFMKLNTIIDANMDLAGETLEMLPIKI